MAALRGLANVSPILFGSDYPLLAVDPTVEGLSQLGLPAPDIRAIVRDNALRIFPRLAVGQPV